MTDNGDQLARLGEQVVATITAAYNPHNDSTLALALHPGQPLADSIVQAGVVNELRLSEWLAAQYDTPMSLKLADGTPVTTTSLGGITAKSAYVTMARWAQPGVPADSAAFPRLAQLISEARQDIGEHPEALPFGCEPTDFALAQCPAWQVFDTTISTHVSQETTTPAAPQSEGSTPTVELNPELWKLRALSEVTIAELPRRRRMREEVQQFSQELPSLSHEVTLERVRAARFEVQPELAADTVANAVQPELAANAVANAALTIPVASLALQVAPAFAVADVADQVSDTAAFTLADQVSDTASLAVTDQVSDTAFARARFVGLADVASRRQLRRTPLVFSDSEANEVNEIYLQPAQASVRLDATLAQELVHVDVADLVDQPAVSAATTSDSSLHVHFEYVVLSITRLLAGRPWWHPEFVEEPACFVPGMKRGALVPDSADPAYGQCLPQSLLLVRNVNLTGVWSDEARATMNESVHYFGPFLMSPPDSAQSTTTDAQHAEQTTIIGLGVQVIGELCSKLPALPPMDDPALAAH